MLRLLHRLSNHLPRPGFTLMEMLVVTAILLVVVTSVAYIFSTVSKTQKRIYLNQQVQSNLRFAVESIARVINTSTIDYGFYASHSTDLTNPQSMLVLRSANNEQVIYQYQSGACNSAMPGTLTLSLNGGVTSDTLLASVICVTSAQFYIRPISDPFAVCTIDPCTNPNEQPRVTIALNLLPLGQSASITDAIFFQTTVTTRTYRR